MKITCIGHSGFALESEDGSVTLIFDYYTDHTCAAPAILERAQSIYVFVSHSHRDHLCHDIFAWHERYPIARYVIANECRRKLKRAIAIEQLPITFLHHDEDLYHGGIAVHAFGSTDVGVSYLVDVAGKRVFHAGDCTCWAMEGDDAATVRKARGDFKVILKSIAHYAPTMDVAMMPVVPNLGGDFAYGAREFLRAVQCKLFVPMHMWGRDREATQFELYKNPAYGTCMHIAEGESVDI